ncbi:MAG: hypothetical protein ACW981_06075 [Candidatus Hodarchaeales archaeon]|jgi:hypothetical protein
MKQLKQLFVFLAIFMLIFGSVQLLTVQAQDSSSETSEIESSEVETETSSEPDDDNNDEEKDEGEEEKDDDEDGIDDEVELKEERELEVELSAHEAKIKSELKSGDNKNKIEVEIKAENEFEIDFRYKTESTQTEEDLRIFIEFKSLIEFVDNTTNVNNTVGGYDNSDATIKEVDFDEISWVLDMVTSDQGGQTLYTINVTGIHDGATITFLFYFATNFVVIDNSTLLQPTAAKFDLVIENYSYDSSDSQLALLSKLKSKLESEDKDEDTEDEEDGVSKHKETGLNFGDTDFIGFFTWVDEVNVDGVNESIVSSPVLDDDEVISNHKVYFSFPQGNKIVWDPKVGVSRDTTGTLLSLPPSSQVPGFEAIPLVILPLIGLVALFNRRK